MHDTDAELMERMRREGLVEEIAVERVPCDAVESAWAAFMATQDTGTDLDVQLSAYERYLVALDRHLDELRQARSRAAPCQRVRRTR